MFFRLPSDFWTILHGRRSTVGGSSIFEAEDRKLKMGGVFPHVRVLSPHRRYFDLPLTRFAIILSFPQVYEVVNHARTILDLFIVTFRRLPLATWALGLA